MMAPTIFKQLVILSILQFTLANVIRSTTYSPLLPEETQEEFERRITLETEEFLNSIFKNQIGFFNKVKQGLKPETQRYKDIEAFVEELKVARQEQDLSRKDELYWNSFKKFDKPVLLLNDPVKTGLSNDEYQKILEENGLKDLMTNFLVDVASYFWKMAKHSGKVLETTVDRFVENMQKEKVVF